MSTEITVRNDFTVGLVDHMGGDESVLRAMLVASDKDDPSEWRITPESMKKSLGRIGSIMRDRHGSPFEHNAMTFYVEAPIFVFREWHRHRIGVSINEQSGRYSELPPMFYVPPPHRPLIKVDGTKQMDYVSELASEELHADKCNGDMRVFAAAYAEYQRQLDMGIVKESARNVLPVALYSKMYWTCNARSLMAFLSLRVRVDQPLYKPTTVELEDGSVLGALGELYTRSTGPSAMFPSKPQWEINQCANLMEVAAETAFMDLFPITYSAFVANGRVAP